ncbi:hypothetical protein BpHYR1_023885 [Brachionus plicatilis]|uniref:Uncharacterized protein n=1 Tax=Brachionus plicatilis TaxID=10195 RepID=A0A3M7R8A5_BRAPC|nr:hypothetical protein BpHYR1_023885 [Brachionus plicatilis]
MKTFDVGSETERKAIITPDIYTEYRIETTGTLLGVDYHGGNFTMTSSRKTEKLNKIIKISIDGLFLDGQYL